MRLKSNAKTNMDLLNVKSTSELFVVKNWKEKCNCFHSIFSNKDSFHYCKISLLETLGYGRHGLKNLQQ